VVPVEHLDRQVTLGQTATQVYCNNGMSHQPHHWDDCFCQGDKLSISSLGDAKVEDVAITQQKTAKARSPTLKA